MSKYYLINPELYDNQFWWKKDDLEFWKNQLLNHKNKRILELAAGTGRIAESLVREGALYTGLELSSAYVKFANQKLQNQFGDSHILQGDMREFKLSQLYDYIFIGFNSFLHLLTEVEAIKCLLCIKQHMKKNSILYIDLFVPDPMFLNRSQKDKLQILNFHDNKINKQVDVYEKLEYNSESEIASITWSYIADKASVYTDFLFNMKIYYPDTMHKIIEASGLSIIDIFGSYDEEKFNENSSLQIYKCMLK